MRSARALGLAVAVPALLVGCAEDVAEGSRSASSSASTTVTSPREPSAVLDIGGYPNGVAVVAGQPWVADPVADQLSRHDPGSGAVDGRVQVGTGAFMLSHGFGALGHQPRSGQPVEG